MKIQDNTIIFKSIPENYHKERIGLKCNTVRTITKISEYKEFLAFMTDFNTVPNFHKIQIINTITDESFIRQLSDITPFEDYYIFSWRHEE